MDLVFAAASGGWWWWWIAVVVLLLLIPLGYGWGYRGYGAPRFPARRRAAMRGGVGPGAGVPERGTGAAVDDPGDPWGPLGVFIWVILLIVIAWLIVLWIW